MSDNFDRARQQLANALWGSGAVLTKFKDHPLIEERQTLFGKERGFRLKHHERHPATPLSPIRLNLRMRDCPSQKGPLAWQDVDFAARCMQHIVWKSRLEFDAIAGVPHAGDPFAEGLSYVAGKPVLWLLKHNDRVSGLGKVHGSVSRVLLVDDVITRATSKIEALEVVSRAGITVNDVLVVVDRNEGGREELEQRGCRVHSVFSLSEIIEIGVKLGEITGPQDAEIRQYLNASVRQRAAA